MFNFQNQNFTYNVDIIMCIDATASMGPIIDEVKRTALQLPRTFLERMDAMGKHSDMVRFKVIAFRDYGVDAEPMIQSDFFTMDEADKFEQFVRKIDPIGGGDIPENSLEALSYAIKSDWCSTGTKRRHVMVLFTDAPALNPEDRKDCKNYPKARDVMPTSLADFIDWWDIRSQQAVSIKMNAKAKRLVLYAPDAYPWKDLGTMQSIIHKPISASSGCGEISMDDVIELLVNSI
jgi:hypothetical protein